ncbi:MAG: cysteine desulfurase family protein [Tissierellia bacterium]|nr:cysteine desulfurase family protein [Tissierellia bacterium]
MIYFDYAATSLKRKEIFEDILNNFTLFDGNADSLHKYGREARKILNESRKIISHSLEANEENIYFTSGASESNNTILKNFKNKKIMTSSIEHPSIINAIDTNQTVVYLNPDRNGNISFDDFVRNYSDDIDLVSLMYVNNETGNILPIKEIGDYLKDKNTWFHVDAVQAYSHLDIDVEDINCDSLSLSGHKIGGINGFGILFARRKFENLIYGGEQEQFKRAGTSFVIGAYSMAKSYQKAFDEQEHLKMIKNYFLKKLNNSSIEYEINGDLENQSPHILNIYFPFTSSEFLLTYLDMRNICVSAGSACSAGSLEHSYVIEKMYNASRAKHSVRFSFGFKNQTQDIDKLIEVLESLYRRKNEG